MNRTICLTLLVALTACGGGGSSGDNGNGRNGGGGTSTFNLSGFVSSAITGSAIQGVTLSLSGGASATTTTDGTGNYTFAQLGNGTYTVTANLADAVFSPDSLTVTINGANSTNNDFVALRADAFSDIQFLPASFLSTDQLRVSLRIADGHIIYSDSSDKPIKKQPLDGSPLVELADRFDSAENVTLNDGNIYWVEGGDLFRMESGGQVTMLVDGVRSADADVTADLVVDATHIYWVDQASQQSCSPPCDWIIQKVPLGGGDVIDLATADRRIDSLVGDTDNIFWEEGSLEPWTPECNCGSKIKSVSKSGGNAILLVDGSLNGTLPPPPPGHIPGSWFPTGGIAVSANDIFFAVAGNAAYDVKSIPKSGGMITDLANVASAAGFSRNAILDITVGSDKVLWIDTANADLKSISLDGSAPSTIASGLVNPGGLAVNSSTAFWTESGAFAGCCLAMGQGSVREVSLAGGNASTLVSNLDAPTTISVDETRLVWSEFWRIAEAPIIGGDATTLVSGIAGNMVRIAVSQSNIYILDGLLIKTVPLAGGKVEKLAPASSGAIGDISVRNGDIAADNDSIYWTVLGIAGGPVVRKVSTAGGAPVILANEPNIPNPQDCYWRVAVDQQNVYWSEGSMDHPVGCALKKVPLMGGAVTTLVDQAFLADFAVDGVDVFFSELSTDTIRKISVDGGAAVIVAENVFAFILEDDSTNLYWLDPRDSVPGNFGIMPKTAGPFDWSVLPVEVVMDPFLALDALLVDESGIFISESTTGSIYRIY